MRFSINTRKLRITYMLCYFHLHCTRRFRPYLSPTWIHFSWLILLDGKHSGRIIFRSIEHSLVYHYCPWMWQWLKNWLRSNAQFRDMSSWCFHPLDNWTLIERPPMYTDAHSLGLNNFYQIYFQRIIFTKLNFQRIILTKFNFQKRNL